MSDPRREREREREREAAGQGPPPAPEHPPGAVEDFILSEEDERDRVPLQKLKLLGNLWSSSGFLQLEQE